MKNIIKSCLVFLIASFLLPSCKKDSNLELFLPNEGEVRLLFKHSEEETIGDDGEDYFYITNEFTMRQVLNLYIEAWKAGVKTIYYVRSKSLEVEDCDSCSA